MEGMRGLRFLVLLALLLAASTAAGDPAVTQPSPTEGLAQWTFSNPANYTLANVVLGPGGASLAWSSGSLIDSSAADFGSAGTQSNLDLTTQPGDVLIADTSVPGPLQSVDMPNTAFSVNAPSAIRKSNSASPATLSAEFPRLSTTLNISSPNRFPASP